jgi:hypothetical protein
MRKVEAMVVVVAVKEVGGEVELGMHQYAAHIAYALSKNSHEHSCMLMRESEIIMFVCLCVAMWRFLALFWCQIGLNHLQESCVESYSKLNWDNKCGMKTTALLYYMLAKCEFLTRPAWLAQEVVRLTDTGVNTVGSW